MTTKLSDERTAKLLGAIGAGNTIETSAAYAGIGRQTYYDWVRRGRTGEAPYAAFVERLDLALAQAEVTIVAQIALAARDPKHWTAGAWLLERRYPHKWGRKDRLEVTGKDGEPVKVEHTKHALDVKADELAERRAAKNGHSATG